MLLYTDVLQLGSMCDNGRAVPRWPCRQGQWGVLEPLCILLSISLWVSLNMSKRLLLSPYQHKHAGDFIHPFMLMCGKNVRYGGVFGD